MTVDLQNLLILYLRGERVIFLHKCLSVPMADIEPLFDRLRPLVVNDDLVLSEDDLETLRSAVLSERSRLEYGFAQYVESFIFEDDFSFPEKLN